VKKEEETAMFCLPTHVLATESWATAWPLLRRQPSGMVQATPLEILRSRYARGELSQQEFESMRHSLERS
jgi:uncharacterized membrane protein